MTSIRRPLTVAAAVAAALACALPALAAWTTSSTGGAATAKATALQQVGSLSASVTSASVALTWSAPATGAVPSGYTVTRTLPSTVVVCSNVAATSCTDLGLAAGVAYAYSVVPVVGNWTGPASTANATTLTAGSPNFLVAIAGSPTVGIAHTVSVTARNGSLADPAYSGTKTLTFGGAAAGPLGDAPTASATVSFVNGVGSASVTFYGAETIAAFTVTEGGRTGSTPVTVVANVGARLRFGASSVRTGNSGSTFVATDCANGARIVVGNGGIFRSKVAVTDLWGNPVANGATARTVTVTRSVTTIGAVTGSPLTIAANAAPAESAGTFDYTHGTGSSADNVITASSAGIASVSCTIGRT